MIKKIASIILLSTIIFTVSCKNNNEKADKSVKSTSEEIAVSPVKATFTIEGMTCAIGCAKTIEEKLSETIGVQNIKVDFDHKSAEIVFDSSKLNQQALTQLVEMEGDGKTYKVSNFAILK